MQNLICDKSFWGPASIWLCKNSFAKTEIQSINYEGTEIRLPHANFYNSLIWGFEARPGTAFSFLWLCDQQYHCKQAARRREDLTSSLLPSAGFACSLAKGWPATAPDVAMAESGAEMVWRECGFFLQKGPFSGPEEPKSLLCATLEECGGSISCLGPGSHRCCSLGRRWHLEDPMSNPSFVTNCF